MAREDHLQKGSQVSTAHALVAGLLLGAVARYVDISWVSNTVR